MKDNKRNVSREDDEEATTITYRENDTEFTEEELHQEELRIFELRDDEDSRTDKIEDAVLMTLNEEEFGLVIEEKTISHMTA